MDETPKHQGATLAEAIVGLSIFAFIALAVVGVLIQTANLDKKDTQLTQASVLADGLLERQISRARVYENFRHLSSTPAGMYWEFEAGRKDSLETLYLYRLEVTEPIPALKKCVVSVFHRDPDFPTPTVNLQKGRGGHALTVGTTIREPSR